ncbi:Uncharacterised protein [Escherichia coli]|nr:Uncharacterised protein [Escherichia coli]
MADINVVVNCYIKGCKHGYSKKNSVEMKTVCELIISRDDMKDKIQDRIQKGLLLLQKSINNNSDLELFNADYRKWSDFNAELLKRSFTNDDFKEEYEGGAFGVISLYETSLGEKSVRLRVNSRVR